MDGNARVKRSLAAMVTTFGVGELSALNGVGQLQAARKCNGVSLNWILFHSWVLF